MEKQSLETQIRVLSQMLSANLAHIIEKTPPRNSIHECLGFIEEEYHELKQEIFKKEADHDDDMIINEAYDVMITAARTILFIQDKNQSEWKTDTK